MTTAAAKKKVSAAQGLARLLTLACFFHFAGMNNGYTAMMDSAPQPLRSTAAVANLAQSAFSVVRAPALQTIRSGQKLLSDAVFGALEFYAFISAAAAEILPDESHALFAAARTDADSLRYSAVQAGGWTRLVSFKQEYGLKTETASASPRIGRVKVKTLLNRPDPLRVARASETSRPRTARAIQKIIRSGGRDGDAPSSCSLLTRFSSTLFVSPSQNRSEASIRAVVFLG